MSQVVAKPTPPKSPLAAMCEPVREELERVEDILRAELRSDHPFVDELVKYGFRISGKRLRPAMLLLAGKAVGEIGRDHLVLAAVVEMIHTATLVHDDVLDEATLRRHVDTVNARWNNEASVLLGDYLFTHSFYLASTLDSTYACRTIGRATNIVCEGELRQVHQAGNLDLSEEEYLAIIDAKTAELCACCCRLGAHCGGADSATVERLADFGRSLGIAFQITDDLLDLVGDERVAGKSLGTDLKKQKATLPVIRALQSANNADRESIRELLHDNTPRNRARLRDLLQKHGAIDYAVERARQFADRANAGLGDLEDNPAVRVLRNLTEFIVSRRH